jgi:hypothetical protein
MPRPFLIAHRENATIEQLKQVSLLERLDQAIFDVIDNPQKTQQTTASGTLF